MSNGTYTLPVGLEIKEECENFAINFEEAFASGLKVSAHATEIFNYSGPAGYYKAQGAATDGRYVYTAMKKELSNSVEVDKIVKIDMTTWEVVQESEELPLDHANDMTYDPVKDLLVVTNMKDCKITLIDCDTLTVVETKTPPYGTYGAGYLGDGKIVFLGYGYPSGIVIASSTDYTPISSSTLVNATGYTGQGLGNDENYIYVPLSPGAGNNDNIVQIYTAEGEYLGTAHMALNWESETIFYDGNDLYVQFNKNGSTIAKLEFYIPFQ